MSTHGEGREIRIQGPPVCRRCRGVTFERVRRTSFFQRQIMPFFNRYPWRCVFCNKMTYRPERTNAQLSPGRGHHSDA